MPNSFRSTLDTRVLDLLVKNLDGNVEDAVAKVAFSLEGRTKIKIRDMEAIDTGALLNSVGVSMKGGGDAKNAQSAAKGRNPEVAIAELPTPKDKHTAHVGPQVEYAEAVHFGEHGRAGRPYLLEAVNEIKKDLKPMLAKAITKK